jgi:2-polyprenyl-3-methyl-5-hydroxy-6-metoxy-1,4-benzoquinol methylase
MDWVHRLISNTARETYGLDLDFLTKALPQDESHYVRGSAEDFFIDKKFSAIFAGDLIEHLSNPGLFLVRSREHLATDGRLILTTPNAFNLFSLVEKVFKGEPTVNKDHTCYFNLRTLKQLLKKNGWQVVETHYLYSLDLPFKESWRKKLQNVLYKILSLFTNSYLETIVVIARPK